MELLDLIGLIYESALDDELQKDVLAQVRRRLDGDVAFYNVHDASSSVGAIEVADGFTANDMASYRELSSLNKRIQGAIQRYGSGEAASGEDVVPARVWKNSEFYSLWAKSRNYVHDIGLLVDKSETVAAALVVGRDAAGGAYTQAEANVLTTLVPHLRRALEIRKRLQCERDNVRVSWEALDRLRVGVALLDHKGCTLFANAALRGIFARHDGLALHRKTLVAAHHAANAKLQLLIAQCRQPEGLVGATKFKTSAPRAQAQPYSLVVCPIRLPAAQFNSLAPCAIVFVHDPDDVEDTPDVAFRQRFQLTAAEFDVVCALVRGESLRAFAERSAKSINTVRVLVKRAFAKTGTHTQSQLIRAAMEMTVYNALVR